MELLQIALVERNGIIGYHQFGIGVTDTLIVWPLWQRNNYFLAL